MQESSESDAGLKLHNNLLLHDTEELIKEEVKKAFDYQAKANKLFKKSNYDLALEEYKKVKAKNLNTGTTKVTFRLEV